jgi:hypothetical protein
MYRRQEIEQNSGDEAANTTEATKAEVFTSWCKADLLFATTVVARPAVK